MPASVMTQQAVTGALDAAFGQTGVDGLLRALRLVEETRGLGAHQLLQNFRHCAEDISRGLAGLLVARRAAEAAEFIAVLHSHPAVLTRVASTPFGDAVALAARHRQPAVESRNGGLPGLIVGVANTAATDAGRFGAAFAAGYAKLDGTMQAAVIERAASHGTRRSRALLAGLTR